MSGVRGCFVKSSLNILERSVNSNVTLVVYTKICFIFRKEMGLYTKSNVWLCIDGI